MTLSAATDQYANERYGFTLRIPRWWRPYYTIRKTRQDPSSEYELHFTFRYGGKRYDDIFTLLVYRMTRAQWLREGYGDSPLVFLAEADGRVFAYLTPEELPYAFVNPVSGDYDYAKYGKPIRLLKKMVNRDVPRLVRTLRFPRTRVAGGLRPEPYLSARVCSSARRGRSCQTCRRRRGRRA